MPLGIILSIKSGDSGLQALDIRFSLLFVLFELDYACLLRFNRLLQLLLLLFLVPIVTIEFGLLFLKLVNSVLLLLEFLLFFHQFRFEFHNLTVKGSLSQFKIINLILFGLNVFLKLFLLSDKLVNGVILTKRKS